MQRYDLLQDTLSLAYLGPRQAQLLFSAARAAAQPCPGTHTV